MTRKASAALTLVMVSVMACASPGPPASSPCALSLQEISSMIGAVHDRQANVGLSASARHDGELMYTETRGFSDIEHQVLVTPDTRFGLASITKLFTAVTLLKLHEEGLVDLAAPVQQYVPDFPEKAEGTITLEMLVTHRSGIPHQRARTPELFSTHYDKASDTIALFADAPLDATPGTERVYSSSNYNLLAAVMENITGKDFDSLVTETLLDPLGLESTTFDDIRYPVTNRSERYSYYDPWTYEEGEVLFQVPRWDYSFNPGGGNLTATADDVSRFGSALLGPGFLNSESLELLFDDRWFGRQSESGETYISVTGSNPGVQTGLAIHPDNGLVVAVLSNTWGKGARSGEMVLLASEIASGCDTPSP